jgi:hypothetical protein
VLQSIALSSVLLLPFLLFLLFDSDLLLNFEKLVVGLLEFLPGLSCSFLSLDISQFLSFELLLDLFLDELSLELLLLHFLDVIELEVL